MTSIAPPATRPSTRAALPWVAFTALALGQLLVDIDDTVLSIALPTVARELHLTQAALPWVVNAYVLTFGGLLLVGGRLADRFGSRPILLAGVGTFALASLGGAVAVNHAALVTARAGQGLAGALLAPAAMNLLVRTFPEPAERSRALGLWGAVTGSGAVVGLVAGGLVTQSVGWRWLFLGNAVLALVVALGVALLLPRGTGDPTVRIALVPAASATLGLVAGLHALDAGRDEGWTGTTTLAWLAAAAALLAVAVRVQLTGAAPLVPRALLRDRAVVVSDVAALLVGAALLGTFFFLSLHLQQVFGWSALRTAVAYLPLVAALVTAAAGGSALVPRAGARPVLAGGLALCAAGLGLLARFGLDAAGSYLDLLPGLVVVGLGLGLAFVALTVGAVPAGAAGAAAAGGAASGLYNTALQVGGALGVSLLSAVAAARAGAVLHQAADAAAQAAALTQGRQLAMWVAAATMLGGVAVALALPSRTGRE
jgi:EmrB/QacA subfamily drug resistance transporter